MKKKELQGEPLYPQAILKKGRLLKVTF